MESGFEQDASVIKMNKAQKKQKHNYTSELELKSLLIRIKNSRAHNGDEKLNSRINKYVIWHTKMNAKKYKVPAKRNRIKAILKERIIRDSELTSIDQKSYERFGQIILLMVKNILTKQQFSGYTYKDDFYSDAVYKILKYLHNFDHTMISERTGQSVNAFAYISQIIHNSILYIINTKKKENDRLKMQVQMANLDHNLQLKTYELVSNPEPEIIDESIIEDIDITEIKTNVADELRLLQDKLETVDRLNVYYPKKYRISFDEYNEIKDLLQGKISLMRKKS